MGGAVSQPDDLVTDESPESDASDSRPDTPPVLVQDSRSGDALPVAPTEFKWSFGGHNVYVTGAWDDWRVKASLSRVSPHEFVTVLALLVGTYQYKFIVDGNWKHSPAQPTERDQHGNLNNVITITPPMPEYDTNEPLITEQIASSPLSSYDFSMLPQEDHTTEPPMLPKLLSRAPFDRRARGRGGDGTDFVRLNHMFSTNSGHPFGARERDLRTLASEVRYKSTIITTILVTSKSKVLNVMDMPAQISRAADNSDQMDDQKNVSLGESQSLLLDALNNV